MIVPGLVLRINPYSGILSTIMLMKIRDKQEQIQDVPWKGINTVEKKAILAFALSLTHLWCQVLPGPHSTKRKKESWNQNRQD